MHGYEILPSVVYYKHAKIEPDLHSLHLTVEVYEDVVDRLLAVYTDGDVPGMVELHLPPVYTLHRT